MLIFRLRVGLSNNKDREIDGKLYLDVLAVPMHALFESKDKAIMSYE